MTLLTPQALLLLALAAPLVWLGWPQQRFRRARDAFSLGLRLLILLCIVLALSGLQVSQSADRLAVVFLVDVSDSLGPELEEEQLAWVETAMAAMGADDLAGIVAFGAQPFTERAPGRSREADTLQSQPGPDHTDLAAAIRHGSALLPGDAARRLVLLSDGRATLGDAPAAARQAAAAGIEISHVVFSRSPGPEVQLTGLDAPAVISADQPFDVTLSVLAGAATDATLTVLDNNDLLQRETLQLRAGASNYTLTLPGSGDGFRDIRARIDPQGGDGYYQNNQLAAFTRVVGPPRTLLLVNDPAEALHLLPALEQAGVQLDVRYPREIPVGLAPLLQYESVILLNLSSTTLGQGRMEALERFVRDLGGGLVAIGGPDSFAPGGWYRTPLEDVLPLEMQIRDQQRLPQLTITYLIDRSGSMGMTGPSGVANVELAKEAIIRSLDFLQPSDRAGVVSFDTEGSWIAELQPVLDRLGLQRRVATLRAGGGTDILAGLRLAGEAMRQETSQRKHIILLTDGGAKPDGLVELSEELRRNADVTTSVISIGQGAEFLRAMAEVGDGNYHEVREIVNVPTIFTMETVLASRSYLVEEPFFALQLAPSPVLSGFDGLPGLRGYVATSPKQTARVVLAGPAPWHDPLLATWQYGLGRALAFTSDAGSRWASAWTPWEGFTRFWGQALRWTMTAGRTDNLEARVQPEGQRARLVVDARDEDGDFLNGLQLEAHLVSLQQDTDRITLQQAAPGRYEALFTPAGEGALFINIQGEGLVDGATQQFAQTAGWVRGYSAEYDSGASGTRGADRALLRELAGITGGRDMTETPALAFEHNLQAREAATPLWPWLLLTALLLLPLDIAVRRVVITRGDLRRLRMALFGFSRPLTPEGPGERLASLMAARDRGRERITGGVSRRVGRAVGSSPEQAEDPPARDEEAEVTRRRPARAGLSTTAALLRTRRQRRGAGDDGDSAS
ncbi:MAG: VWA domain-containing protein [Anaerolineaceae bacterium]|nr:VWA domain-containing protein [Anaerolineaceae bacterium]